MTLIIFLQCVLKSASFRKRHEMKDTAPEHQKPRHKRKITISLLFNRLYLSLVGLPQRPLSVSPPPFGSHSMQQSLRSRRPYIRQVTVESHARSAGRYSWRL